MQNIGLIEISVEDSFAGWRLDKFLHHQLPDLSRTRLQDLLKKGHIVLLYPDSESLVLSSHQKVRQGECYQVRIPEPTEPVPQPQALPLSIVYEDEDLLVIDKPVGLVVHPAAGHPDHTLVNALLAYCGKSLSGIGGVKRPGIVHRLDKDTSGLLVVAKNDKAHIGLSNQFSSIDSVDSDGVVPKRAQGKRSLKREYWAAVWGLTESSGKIEVPIGRSPHNRQKMAVVIRGGKSALTRYKRLNFFQAPPASRFSAAPVSVVACRLETGRTHQIRVHFKQLGFPLIGDPIYGISLKASHKLWPSFVHDFPRQALHAHKLSFIHPTHNQVMQFESPLPEDLQRLLTEIETVSFLEK